MFLYLPKVVTFNPRDSRKTYSSHSKVTSKILHLDDPKIETQSLLN